MHNAKLLQIMEKYNKNGVVLFYMGNSVDST